MSGPSADLVRALLDGPSMLAGLEWHEEIDSTMRRAGERAAGGCPEGVAVLADVQSAGRGRRGRDWSAPAGTSLLCSLVLRPATDQPLLPLLGLLAGVALAGCAAAHAPAVDVALKWPNDLLLDGRKAAGVLLEAGPGEAVVLGIGLNVDWRGVARPAHLGEVTSLAEAAGTPVDRWRLFAALVGVFGNRYAAWRANPLAFLDEYRQRCATLGRRVRVALPAAGEALVGVAETVSESGALVVREESTGRRHEVHAGDVEHVRPEG